MVSNHIWAVVIVSVGSHCLNASDNTSSLAMDVTLYTYSPT